MKSTNRKVSKTMSAYGKRAWKGVSKKERSRRMLALANMRWHPK